MSQDIKGDTGAIAPAFAEQFDLLVAAFLRENAVINLSSIRDESGVREKHIADSLAAVEFLHAENIRSILDLGTGGGFPLLPLAITFPQKTFSGLDSVGKKLAAIERIAAACEIRNIRLLNGRAEAFGRHPQYRETFDAVTARAVAKFPVMLELASPFLKPGGSLICYRGPESDSDDEAVAKLLNLKVVQKVDYQLTTGEKRVLWIFVKQGKISNMYPRAVGVPKQKPLIATKTD